MTFNEALKELNIEDYAERIFHSNSHGELIHLMDYVLIAETFTDKSWFRDWFIMIVEHAEKHWKRPESIFQHIPRCLDEWEESMNKREVK
jgi:hypothetical protein